VFNSKDIVDCLKGLGACAGDCLYFHCDYGHMKNFEGTPTELIDALRALAGPEGTIAFPSYPERASRLIEYLYSDPLIDVKKTPTKMGILQELFRRRPDTLRSLHAWASVSASGPLAKWLLEEHHLDRNAFSPLSPYAKMREAGGKIVGINADLNFSAYIHMADDILKDYYPFPVYIEPPIELRFIDWLGNHLKVDTQIIRNEISTCIYPIKLKPALVEKGVVKIQSMEDSLFYVMKVSDYLDAAIEAGLDDMSKGRPPRWLDEHCKKYEVDFKPCKEIIRS
jgi:aminoglycoside N3'-acetyltransferase